MDKTLRGTLEMAAAMTISGTIGWVVVTSGQPVPVLLFWRCLLGAATLALFCVAFRRWRRLSARELSWAALGGVAIVSNWLLLFASYSHASISIATAVYNTQPFMLVGLGVLFLHERVTLGRLGWLVLAFAGVVLVAQAKPGSVPPGANYAWGITLALGAAALYGLAAFIAKKLTGTPPHLIALVQTVVGAAMLAPWGWGAGLPRTAGGWAPLLALGVVYTGVMYILLYGALQKLPSVLAGVLSFIYPMVAMLVDYIAFGQRLDAAQWLGSAAILLAAAGLQLAPQFARKAPSAA